MDIASSWSCVTMTKVRPSCSCRRTSSKRVPSRSLRSSAASGSSSSRSFGRLTSARASATRWRWPPESCAGWRVPQLAEPHQRRAPRRRARAISALGQAFAAQPVADVRRHIHVREQGVGLEHHVDRPAMRRHAGHVLAVDQDAAGVGRLEARQQAQQRGLAAARAAQQARTARRARCRDRRRRRPTIAPKRLVAPSILTIGSLHWQAHRPVFTAVHSRVRSRVCSAVPAVMV